MNLPITGASPMPQRGAKARIQGRRHKIQEEQEQ